ncbi:hypothetical protein BDZ94DRAFT_1311910 [Collybia nuda]|uniref:Uncharacterized protein n=1 Tax=Collybia nuda TaxID=64659 RepID=A0A9P5Y216_9AGAR|nr:hypothetical protein BDZ94DRAFT_1311910 [Collybia nuda]
MRFCSGGFPAYFFLLYERFLIGTRLQAKKKLPDSAETIRADGQMDERVQLAGHEEHSKQKAALSSACQIRSLHLSNTINESFPPPEGFAQKESPINIRIVLSSPSSKTQFSSVKGPTNVYSLSALHTILLSPQTRSAAIANCASASVISGRLLRRKKLSPVITILFLSHSSLLLC